MLNRATALLNFADADAQFQRRYCSISPAEALNFNAVCKVLNQQNTFVEMPTEEILGKSGSGIAATVHISGANAEIHNGADEATLTAIFRALKSC